jgi:cytochrome c oxidase assembly factor CtaG
VVAASTPLTLTAALTSWQLDVGAASLILLTAGGYAWCRAKGRSRDDDGAVAPGHACCFGAGMAMWVLATMSMIGVYADVLFWVRALQVLLLLFVVPFFIALGRPLSVLRGALGGAGQARFDQLLATRGARVAAHPATTSIAMLATPWLLYLTPWYLASLRVDTVAAATRILLVVIGFGYFYARLQADPVPHRYSQLVSMIISIAETIGDGLLGIVLWLGPLIAAGYYLALHRTWGPSPRVDQSIGAGILWILGDVLGLPFLIVLMRALAVDEKALAAEIDAQLDQADELTSAPDQSAAATPDPGSALWWEDDPQLQHRFKGR